MTYGKKVYIATFVICGAVGLAIAALSHQAPIYIVSFTTISAFVLLLDFMDMKQEAMRAKKEGTQASYVSTAHGPIVAFILATIITAIAWGHQHRQERASNCGVNCTQTHSIEKDRSLIPSSAAPRK
jgi:hypothetical protein